MIQRSESIATLAGALSKAQAEIEGASKDKSNPHFKSKYADLSSVWDACRDALSKNGLAVLQPVSSEGAAVTVTTLLTHSSGEWVSSDLTMTAQQPTPQGIGSCITYARRYALASMVGVAPEDDDGNAASGRPVPDAVPQERSAAPRPVAVAPAGYEPWLAALEGMADEGSEALQKAWTSSKVELRRHLTQTDLERWNRIKAKGDRVDAKGKAS